MQRARARETSANLHGMIWDTREGTIQVGDMRVGMMLIIRPTAKTPQYPSVCRKASKINVQGLFTNSS